MKGSIEYSLAQLLEHPALVVMMTSAGIERRSLDLILDALEMRLADEATTTGSTPAGA